MICTVSEVVKGEMGATEKGGVDFTILERKDLKLFS